MTVKELINKLKNYDPDDVVIYDANNAIQNETTGKTYRPGNIYDVDNAFVGELGGYVLLCERKYDTSEV